MASLLLKPFVRIGYADDVIFAMTQNRVVRLGIEFKGILEDLSRGAFKTDNLTREHIPLLKELDSLELVYSPSGKHSGISDMFEFNNWRETFVVAQMETARLYVADYHSDKKWRSLLVDSLKGMGLTIVDAEESSTLVLALVERMNQVTPHLKPALVIRLGSYIQSVGPLLCSTLSTKDLQDYINPGKVLFEKESFLVPNFPLARLSVEIAAAEILNTVVQAGAYDTIKSIVEWNTTTLRRTVWPI